MLKSVQETIPFLDSKTFSKAACVTGLKPVMRGTQSYLPMKPVSRHHIQLVAAEAKRALIGPHCASSVQSEVSLDSPSFMDLNNRSWENFTEEIFTPLSLQSR